MRIGITNPAVMRLGNSRDSQGVTYYARDNCGPKNCITRTQLYHVDFFLLRNSENDLYVYCFKSYRLATSRPFRSEKVISSNEIARVSASDVRRNQQAREELLERTFRKSIKVIVSSR